MENMIWQDFSDKIYNLKVSNQVLATNLTIRSRGYLQGQYLGMGHQKQPSSSHQSDHQKQRYLQGQYLGKGHHKVEIYRPQFTQLVPKN